MRQLRWVRWSSVGLCAMGVVGIVVFHSLGKDGAPDGERFADLMRVPNLGALALFSSPLLAIAALCLLWKYRHPLTLAGLLAAGAGLGVTTWGNATDYVSWARQSPPFDQVTYLGAVIAMLWSWAICLAYAVGGFLYRSRWFSVRRGEDDAKPGTAPDRGRM